MVSAKITQKEWLQGLHVFNHRVSGDHLVFLHRKDQKDTRYHQLLGATLGDGCVTMVMGVFAMVMGVFAMFPRVQKVFRDKLDHKDH